MTAGFFDRRNIFVLTLAQALGGASAPIIMSLGGIVGLHLADDPALATLPVALYGVGLALGSPPAAYVMGRFGRRAGFLFGSLIGLVAGLIAAWGLLEASFALFCLGTFVAGGHGAYVQSYRFAAADTPDDALKARAISWVMVGGLGAAVLGAQLVILTRDALPGIPFAGSFLAQAILPILAVPALLLLRASSPPRSKTGEPSGRSLSQLARDPTYALAVLTGVVSYGLMAFVMTAAPVAIVSEGHGVDEAALGIQWHLLAMFGPSFITGRLIERFGREPVAALGLLLIACSSIAALAGSNVSHFWLSLILLGLGWNFSFIGATAMVAAAHSVAERAKAQGANDFLVFGTVAIVSFLAGTILTNLGWHALNLFVFPVVGLMLVLLLLTAARRRKGAS
ncbi:MFS transporter [Brucella intermedia]|uniref:Major facilitator superfamily protein n=1 Tax=Brucella intermedia M86 TaxID=1234597 RepID=M5K2Y5_9HYPH|nr:MFS transporter [Brucella intermedia]ELT51224.1 major facilitator superfamily protein [Brucella intermedia M86]